jgi:UTP--glucose-1-phosphate uridylyltransferase
VKIRKAVITAAGPGQRRLPLQHLIDKEGKERSLLSLLVREAVEAGVEEIIVVVSPGDEDGYRDEAGDQPVRLRFVPQNESAGYGHAILSATKSVGQEPFLHLVGDHLPVSSVKRGCAARLVEVAEVEGCSVSAVQATREGLLPRFGAVGGQLMAGKQDLYEVEKVIEKPTPTEAEQKLVVPGLRAGHYLCFFGLHVLTVAVIDELRKAWESGERPLSLSSSLARLPRRERYLALEMRDRRYDLGEKYGLLTAQMALALSGRDREEVLSRLLEVMATRELKAQEPGR